MDDWDTMFQRVQSIAGSAPAFAEGLARTAAFARDHGALYDDPRYWSRVEAADLLTPFRAVVDWAQEGLGRLDLAGGWDFLLADLGDCPDVFHLYRLSWQPLVSHARFRQTVVRRGLIDYEEFLACPKPGVDLEAAFNTSEPESLSYHNVAELGHEILSWNASGSHDYNGKNGELLWLALGSLALVEALRDRVYCRRVLRGRDRLYILTGFESLFFYLGTVTSEGLVTEEPLKYAVPPGGLAETGDGGGRSDADLGNILFEQFGVDSLRSLQARAFLHNMRAVDLNATPPDPDAVNLVPAQIAWLHQVIPITKTRHGAVDVLVLAVADPGNIMAVEDVQKACRLKVLPMLAAADQMTAAIERCYGKA